MCFGTEKDIYPPNLLHIVYQDSMLGFENLKMTETWPLLSSCFVVQSEREF